MGALTDKYCIVGVGETPHMRPSNRTTLSMACEAIPNAMADAGLQARDIDGMTSYQGDGDSTTAAHVAQRAWDAAELRLEILGGGSSTEALVAHAIGLIEARLLQDDGGLPLDERTLGPPDGRAGARRAGSRGASRG